MDNGAYKVSSELYEEYDYTTSAKPIVNKSNVVSTFKFTYPPPPPEIDSDGDLVVSRKTLTNENNIASIEIEHSKSTVLDLVGLQIWRGALLLADWLLHSGKTFKEDQHILELGSGVGLTSIVAGMFSTVFCTDVDKGDLLKLIESNIKRNTHLTKYPVKVLELDFTKQKLPHEIEDSLSKIEIIIAADVIYDDDITEAFVRTVDLILSKPPKKSVYVALEKRYVFTIADCDTTAPCYEYYLESLRKLKNINMEEVPLNFPQYFHYERVKELVLWKITSKFEEHMDQK